MFYRFAVCMTLLLCCIPLLSLNPGVAHNSGFVGTLVDDGGGAVQGHVMGYRLGVRQGRVIPDMECSATADAEGHFQCQHLEAGIYLIVVNGLRRTRSANQDSLKSNAFAPLPLFVVYPANADLEPANLLRLSLGETQSIEIQVTNDSAPEFQVRSAAGVAPGKVLEVYLQGNDFTVPANIRIEPNFSDGNYDAQGIPPGAYRLSEVWSVDGVSHEASASATAAQLGSGDVSLIEMKRYDVSGSIRYPDSAGPAAQEVVLSSAAENDTHRYATTVGKNGTFAFKDIVSGNYYVSFNGDGGLYVSDVSVGGHSADGAPVVVDEGASRLSWTVLAKRASGSIAGALELDGNEPKPRILVESLDFHTTQIVSADAQGSFKLTGLAPGQYLLYGWADISSVPYESPQFLSRYTEKALHVDLDSGATLTGLTVECTRATL